MVKTKPKGSARSMKPFYTALTLIAVVGAATLAYVASRPKAGARTLDPNLPPAKAEGYFAGNPTARVQVVEFADYECPSCMQFATITEPDVRTRLVETGQIGYRFFDYPLPQHRNTMSASNTAACANEQGKFWPMHDRIFMGQYDWNTQASRNPKGIFKGYAKELGLDVDKWEACFDSQVHYRDIEANRAEGERRAINSTPTFIFGSRVRPGNIGYDEFKAIVDSVASEAPAATAPPAVAPVATPVTGAAKPR